MPATDSARADDAPRFRSPKRALARAFRLSRDRWKEKATQRRAAIKDLKIRVRDLEISRELWKEKCLHLQRQLDELLGLVPPREPEEPGTAVPPASNDSPGVVPAGEPASVVAADTGAPEPPPQPTAAPKKKQRLARR